MAQWLGVHLQHEVIAASESGWHKRTGKHTIGGDFSERGVCGDASHVAFSQGELELGRDRTIFGCVFDEGRLAYETNAESYHHDIDLKQTVLRVDYVIMFRLRCLNVIRRAFLRSVEPLKISPMYQASAHC